ncbi:MAG: hypothetical protein PHH36_05140 [Sideroxydans sp.]|nr:hypothetical protein [Sideroxydans sp.]
MSYDLIENLLWRDLAIFLFLGAVLGGAVGLLLIFRPQLFWAINRVANRWLTLRVAERPLDRYISVEHWFYRLHRPFGLFFTIGAAYVMVFFAMAYDKAAAMQALTPYVPAVLMDFMLDALVILLLIGAALALFVGLMLWLRPNQLRSIDAVANRWLSSRRATKVFDVPHNQIDRYVAHHARVSGWVMLAGSGYLFVSILLILG